MAKFPELEIPVCVQLSKIFSTGCLVKVNWSKLLCVLMYKAALAVAVNNALTQQWCCLLLLVSSSVETKLTAYCVYNNNYYFY